MKIVEDPRGRRDEFVEPYFQKAQPDQVMAIIKAREPAGIMTAVGTGQKWHLETKYRWVQPGFFISMLHDCARLGNVFRQRKARPRGSEHGTVLGLCAGQTCTSGIDRRSRAELKTSL